MTKGSEFVCIMALLVLLLMPWARAYKLLYNNESGMVRKTVEENKLKVNEGIDRQGLIEIDGNFQMEIKFDGFFLNS